LHITANALDSAFLKKIKELYKSKRIAITIEEEKDETAFLLKSDANRKFLLESIKQAESGNLVKVKIGKRNKK
jgi:hypothetical protein